MTGKKIKAAVDHKEERFKSFFNIDTLYCKQACKLPKYVLKESKKVILLEVFETIWTRVRTCQSAHAKPLAFKIATSENRTIIMLYK